jgi:hypothetical protein
MLNDGRARIPKSREGRPKVARFQPWVAIGERPEPRRGDRKDGTGPVRSFVPDGTQFIVAPQPSDKSLHVFSAMVGMARCAVPARVVAGGTNVHATVAIEGVTPLHAAPTSQRDVPTALKRYKSLGNFRASLRDVESRHAKTRTRPRRLPSRSRSATALIRSARIKPCLTPMKRGLTGHCVPILGWCGCLIG